MNARREYMAYLLGWLQKTGAMGLPSPSEKLTGIRDLAAFACGQTDGARVAKEPMYAEEWETIRERIDAMVDGIEMVDGIKVLP